MTVTDQQRTGIGFEGQLHVPGVIGISFIPIEVMEPDKPCKRKVFIQFSMFPEVLYQYRQFEELTQFCIGQ